LFFLSVASILRAEPPGVSYQTGDIIFQTSLSPQSKAIQIATNSKYSHVGLLVLRDGKPWVFEAVQPVKYTPLREWIRRGKNGKYIVKRLKSGDKILRAVTNGRFSKACHQFEGKDYDLYFGWGNNQIYCSELVWKVYHEAVGVDLAPLQKMKEFNLSDPRVKVVLRKRYGDNVPLEEDVISPAALFQSGLLTTIKDGLH